MEVERSEKLSELNTTLLSFTEDEAKVKIARIAVVRIVSEVGETENMIFMLEAMYEDHLKFLRSVNRDSPDVRIQSLKPRIQHLQQAVWTITTKLSFLSIQLREANNDQISVINELKEKRDLIKNAKASEELKDVSIAAQSLINSSLLSITNVMKSQWMEMGLQDEVKEVMEELRSLVEEERAQLTGA